MTKESLTDKKRMGGVVAQNGFDYQVWNALIMVPQWLRSPSFEGVIFEGIEDFEARFFSPAAPLGRFIDRFQAKSATLTAAEIDEVVAGFQQFSNHHPSTVRWHALVTPALPARQAWLAGDTARVKRARPFYAPFRSVLEAVDDALRASLAKRFGPELGDFFLECVDVTLMNIADRRSAEVAFGAALGTAFPECDFGNQRITRTFAALFDLASKERGQMISALTLLDLLEAELGKSLVERTVLPLFVRSDLGAIAQAESLEIDASAFSGGEHGFPPDANWQGRLVEPLQRVAAFAQATGRRAIALDGNYRLTTAFLMGWTFRSALGFELSIPTKDGRWLTNEHPRGPSTLPWSVATPTSIHDGELPVVVSVIRDALPAAIAHLGQGSEQDVLRLHLPQAIVSPREAQESVRFIKASLDESINRLRPSSLRLYFVGPAALAVALGHRWNALPPTQLHEFVQPTGYQPTLKLG